MPWQHSRFDFWLGDLCYMTYPCLSMFTLSLSTGCEIKAHLPKKNLKKQNKQTTKTPISWVENNEGGFSIKYTR